jgi:hypothetical protein
MTGAGTVLMTDDADGNRVKKVTGTTTTPYLVAMVNPAGYPQVVEEYAGSGSPTLSRVYNYGPDLISQNQSSGITYYGYYSLGSTRFLLSTAGSMNGSGGNCDIYTYDAYGNLLTPDGSRRRILPKPELSRSSFSMPAGLFSTRTHSIWLRTRWH